MFHRSLANVATCGLLFALSSCATPTAQRAAVAPSGASAGTASSTAAPQDPKASTPSDPKDLDEARSDLADAQHELAMFDMEREIKALDSETDTGDATHAVAAAERSLTLAQKALAHYNEVALPLKRAEAKLSFDRSASRLAATEQDLEGILEIYADEEEARAKNEIIRRNRKSVEFAQRGLENDRVENEILNKFEIPNQQQELAWDVSQAQRELAEAKHKQNKLTLEQRKAGAASAHERAALERKVAKLQQELAEALSASKGGN